MTDSSKWFESLRISYEQGELNESDITHNPFEQFNLWLQDAINNDVPEPNAMVLSTVNKQGQPSARNVLLKSADENGFIFFSNKTSDKATDLKHNPHCSCCFPGYHNIAKLSLKVKPKKLARKNLILIFKPDLMVQELVLG